MVTGAAAGDGPVTMPTWNPRLVLGRCSRFLGDNPFFIAFLALTFFVRLLWAVLIPAFQTPDEIAHYAYVEHLGEDFDLTPSDRIPQDIGVVEGVSGLGGVPYHPDNTPYYAPDSLDGLGEAAAEAVPHSRRDLVDDRENAATQYPATYYLIASVVYRATASFDLFTIFFSVRLLSVVISTVTLLFGWLTLKRFFADERMAMGCALILALHPMYAYMGMAVNPDVLVWLVFAVFLWLVTRALDDGLSHRTNLWIALTIVAGVLVKQTFLVAVPLYLFFLGVMFLKRAISLRDGVVYAAATGVAIAFLDGWLYLSGIIRTDADYPGGVRQDRGLNSFFVEYLNDRWFEMSATYDESWGYFGWLDTVISTTIFDVIRLGSAAAFVGLVFYLLHTLYQRRPDWKTTCYVGMSVIYIAAWVGLNYIRVTSGENWLLQGRYFFPMIVPIFALMLRGFLWYVPEARARGVVLVALVIGMIWLDADILLRYVIPRYYL